MKRERLIPFLLALTLALACLPVRAALAADDYWLCSRCERRVRESVGDMCPYCGYERHIHDWAPATCVTPKTCRVCGATEGDPIDHDWLPATTNAAKTCRVCGKTEGKPLSSVTAGDIVTFGRYEQDSKANGYEAIEWQVLEVDETNGKALLLSRYGLDVKRYHDEYEDTTWAKCTLREWLNKEFLETAFTKAEQGAIVMTEVDNVYSQDNRATNVEEKTQDKIFLLSDAEAKAYFNVTGGNRDNIPPRVLPTVYAKARGAYTSRSYMTSEGKASGRWWLRSGGSQCCAMTVDTDGAFYSNNVNSVDVCVRPALWISLDDLNDNMTVTPSAADSRQSEHTRDVRAGITVTFGTYPQTADGAKKAPIEWLVLWVDEVNHKALLISRYGLDAMPYNQEYKETTWAVCTLREWLNKDFLERAFTETEQNAIVMTEVDNSRSHGSGRWDTKGGENTRDKVFLLSAAEAYRYFNVTWENNNNFASRVSPTAYAKARGAYTNEKTRTTEDEAAGWWWLRSPGNYQHDAADVGISGNLSSRTVGDANGCVRPVLWVNLAFSDLLVSGDLP